MDIQPKMTATHRGMLGGLAIIAMMLALVPQAAAAQSMEKRVQAAINAKGNACVSVTDVQPVAATSGGGAIIAVACADGERYALEIKPDKSIVYNSTCATFQSITGVSCF